MIEEQIDSLKSRIVRIKKNKIFDFSSNPEKSKNYFEITQAKKNLGITLKNINNNFEKAVTIGEIQTSKIQTQNSRYVYLSMVLGLFTGLLILLIRLIIKPNKVTR